MFPTLKSKNIVSDFLRPFAASIACGSGLLVWLPALCLPAFAWGGDERPHILLIMADDLGWKDLACQGNARLRTPHLDRLAQEGIRFSDAYAAAPVCSPTRAALITGWAPARLGITQHGADGPQFWPEERNIQPPEAAGILPLETTTLAERLKEIGYKTGFFGKWHLGRDQRYWPDKQGFDVNVGGCGLGGPPTYFDPYRIPALTDRQPGEYLTDRLAEEASAFLTANWETPTFLCLWTYNPHYPFEAPEDLIQHYADREGPGLKNATYGAQLEATDRAVGRLLGVLDDLELRQRTLVIFTSDNGGWSGATDNRPLREGKGYLYEGGLRVPLIIRWPGHSVAGATSSTPVITMDLTETMLAAAGAATDTPRVRDGVSLVPLLQGEQLEREALFFHYPHFAFHKANRPGAAIRQGNYKLIQRFDNGECELYDLAADLGETRNLAADDPQRVQHLQTLLTEWLTETQAQLPQPVE